MTERARLYVGETVHHRFEPRPHRFKYRVFHLLIDIDNPTDDLRRFWAIRHGRFGLFSFTPRDHGDRDGSPLRPWVETTLKAAGVAVGAHHIRLLAFPRVLGFVFNPISVFFVHAANDRLEAVIYEVNNTFGQTHAYVVPTRGGAVERHDADKALYVSPFYRVEGGYRFRLTPPGETLDLTVQKQTDGRPNFLATLNLLRRPLTNLALLGLFFSMPLMTLGVVIAIHWEAVKLWIKGAPFGARPPGPKTGISAGRATTPR